MKRKISLSVLLLMFSVLTFAQSFSVDNIVYNVISSTEVEVIASPAATGNIIIPSTISNSSINYSVVSIGANAFKFNSLSTVVIPNSVTSIGDYAFFKVNLTSVTLSDNLTTIGKSAFRTNLLTDISIPSSVTSIAQDAFAYNKLTTLTIPISVTNIGDLAFSGNDLTNVSIPSSIVSLGTGVFQHNELTSVTIPSSLTSIGRETFANNNLTSATIPSSVTNIDYGAFSSNQLTSVTIPSSVTSIGGSAFSNNQLTSVTIPSSVTSIGGSAFSSNNITEVTAEYISPIAIDNTVFDVSTSCGGTLYVPDGTVNDYRLTASWDMFGRIYEESKKTTSGICNVTKEDTLNIYLSNIITTVYDASSAATTVKVYPNPADKNLTVAIDNPSNLNGVTIKVINSQSAAVHTEAITGATQTIDVSSWSAGIYFLQVINGSDIVDIRKIVVNN